MDQLCKDMTVSIIPLYAILKACRYNIIICVVYVNFVHIVDVTSTTAV